MLKLTKFVRKPFYVDAIKVTDTNILEVVEWCGGELKVDSDGKAFIKVDVPKPLNDRQTTAYVGDWILVAGTSYKIYTPKAFEKSFEKVKTLTKAQADEAGIKVPIEPKRG